MGRIHGLYRHRALIGGFVNRDLPTRYNSNLIKRAIFRPEILPDYPIIAEIVSELFEVIILLSACLLIGCPITVVILCPSAISNI
jgi:hypothetical protein